MPAAGTFGMKSVDGAAFERPDGVFDEARFIERVGVDHHLHVVVVGYRETAIDCGGGGGPVLVPLERAGAAFFYFLPRRPARGIALAGPAEGDRPAPRR